MTRTARRFASAQPRVLGLPAVMVKQAATAKGRATVSRRVVAMVPAVARGKRPALVMESVSVMGLRTADTKAPNNATGPQLESAKAGVAATARHKANARARRDVWANPRVLASASSSAIY